MSTQELEKKLTNELIRFIKSEGHVESGTLIKSISFQVTLSNFAVDIKLKAKEYIQYLDNGNLLDRFFEQKTVIQLIEEFYSDMIEDLLEF